MATSEPVEITRSESRTGTEKILTFPDTGNQIVLKIPRGIQDGQQIRILYYGNTFLIPVVIVDDPPSQNRSKPRTPIEKALWTLAATAILGSVCYCRIAHVSIAARQLPRF